MLRIIAGAIKTGVTGCSRFTPTPVINRLAVLQWKVAPTTPLAQTCLQFHHLCTPFAKPVSIRPATVVQQTPAVQTTQVRTVTKFSRQKGKRKTVKAVLKRFYRLDWGGWIRTRSGRYKRLWRKGPALQRRLRQHVFCNSTQSWMLDKMVTKYWRKPKYYVEDPYEPYHTREEFGITRKKPL